MDADPRAVSTLRYAAQRTTAHWRWGRTQGWGRLVEEDQLNPFHRASLIWSKARWRRNHGVRPGTAVPVLVVGLQRSGTNMLLRGLEQAPECEVHNENDRAVFDRFRLRDVSVMRDTVDSSRHRLVIFKPLCDSHRTPELLEAASAGRSRGVWIYRDVDGRVRSSIAKFGGNNLAVLQAVASGDVPSMWQAGGLTEGDVELVRGLVSEGLDAASASALFWYLRNNLYFRLGLDRHPAVHLTSYQAFVNDPQGTMTALCTFLDFPYRDELVGHVDTRRATPARPLDLHPQVRELCTELGHRLDEARVPAGS